MSPRKRSSGRALQPSSLKGRKSKVRDSQLGRTVPAGCSFRDWLDSLPSILAGRDLLELSSSIAAARRRKRQVIAGLGAHVIKCGLSPLIVDLIEDGIITAVALNGAGAIHDFELAWAGKTSEDVGPALQEGTFGTASETAEFVNEAARLGSEEGLGLGESLGRLLQGGRWGAKGPSILASAVRSGAPVTVHVALGTDITHMHPSSSGAALGETSLRDFRLLADRVGAMEGGVYLNIGSAVILPEVFLKALAMSRNRLGGKPRRFSTANLDFLPHYRPLQNVVRRPTAGGGRGYQILGHHELLLPLLFGAVREAMVSR